MESDKISSRAIKSYGEVACEFFDLYAKKDETVRVDKFAAIATGRDTDGVKWRVTRLLEDITTRGAEAEINAHIDKYQELWHMGDLEIKGDDKMQKAMRFNIFHLMSTTLMTTELTWPKLMHGEEYGDTPSGIPSCSACLSSPGYSLKSPATCSYRGICLMPPAATRGTTATLAPNTPGNRRIQAMKSVPLGRLNTTAPAIDVMWRTMSTT